MALPWSDSENVHCVDLLECATLTFDDEEVDQETAEDIAAGKDIAVAEVNVACDEWCEECKQEIPEPIGGCRKSHAFGTIARRIEFSADGPDHWAPCSREPKNEERGEADHSYTRFRCVMWMATVQGEVTDGCEDQKADEHPRGADDEGLATTIVLDDVETVEGCLRRRYSAVHRISLHLAVR